MHDMKQIVRVRDVGGAGNKGQFASHYRAEADSGILGVFVEDSESLTLENFTHDGNTVDVAYEGLNHHGQTEYTVRGDEFETTLRIENGDHATPKLVELHTALVLDERNRQIASLRIGLAPILDDKLKAEVARLDASIKKLERARKREEKRSAYRVDGILAPKDFSGDYELTPASAYVDDRLVANTSDPLYARSDWAEVSEDGVTYGVNVNPEMLRSIVIGPQRLADGEGEQSYGDRFDDTFTREDMKKVEAIVKETYDAEVNWEGCGDDAGSFTVEWHRPYPKGETPATVSLEYMGAEAEKKTKLLDFTNAYEYGGGVDSQVAAALGFKAVGTDEHAEIIWERD